ncbi:serine/threonine-protein kinase [Nonomuraea africana]|uniref:non-specific serine/threonine protein kinase n=1 Tax=Nonomuraea africana TaxID=46171 RepID=A0ABR9KIC3_9ACTN|nr:serine/threonine-protein kinase [Nonomuraea africana]
MNERALIGQEVAGYYIEDVIGKGGMAVVYLALDPRLNRRVALKILNPILAVDDRFRQRFILESRTASSIEHPNIIPIYEANSDDHGVLYIAMRYVDGMDLRRLIYDRGPIPIAQVNSIAAQVAAALDAAHAHDLIHRDVKPANILLAGEGASQHVYLTDFGITKHRTSISGLTQTDQFIGTPRYMSPEQINKEHIDGCADQYALACVVYEALAGRMPFERDNDVALLWAHLAESPPPLSQLRPELPLEVDGVMMKAMAKSPEQRYPSCTAFVGALRDAISGQVAPTQPQQPAPAPAKRPKQPKAPKQKAAKPTRAPKPPSSPKPARARKRRLPAILIGIATAVPAIALAVLLVLSNMGEGTQTYKPTAAVPMTFEYPDDWTAKTHVDLFALASPRAAQFESLFVAGPGADWREVNALDPADATGLYVQLADTFDPKADLQTMQDTLNTMLPGKVTFTAPLAGDLVGGRTATRFEGYLRGPDNTGQLRVTGYLVETPTRPALLLYFCAESACDPALLAKIRESVALT